VLLSDMLLVLKARKQGKPHHMEWFADQEYSMKTVSDERHSHTRGTPQTHNACALV